MPQIQQLPPHLADLIAAGEVVERPASVCKELLENALDAGASAISAELEKGGLTYIRITDNGCGIAPDQLPTAFLRHATSKLRRAEDLSAIGTLGFRGEALAAIAAVSRVDIFSRQTGADCGAMLHLEGGVPAAVTEAGCPDGTTVCVRDLFYNTPARMKFMKKDSAEGAAAAGVVTHLALSHPDVSFKLLRDGQEILHTPGDGQLLSAIYAALGRDFAAGLLPVSGSGGSVRAEGFVTRPLAGHGTRGRQLFFVNGRFVKSQLLTAAVEEAYRNRLLKGKFPGCVLHITLPVQEVDVNVHPAKTVVKFVSDKAVFDAVYYREGSAGNDTSLFVTGRPVGSAVTGGAGHPDRGGPAASASGARLAGGQAASRFVPAVRLAEAARQNVPSGPSGQPDRPQGTVLEVRDAVQQPERSFTVPTGREGLVYHITPPEAARHTVQTEDTDKAQDISAERGAAYAPQPDAPEAAPVQQELEMPETADGGEAPWRIAGEVLKTYIICEDGDQNVWLVDKHAAHERIRFDALKADPVPPMAQQLMTPAAVTLTAEEYGAVLERLDTLAQYGFLCEDFGDGTVLVREIPDYIRAEDAAATLEELAQKLVLQQDDPDGARDELLHTMACKSAIKAGMTTDSAELAELVRQVQSGAIRYCPHGRPVAVKLRKYEVEKMFRRA